MLTGKAQSTFSHALDFVTYPRPRTHIVPTTRISALRSRGGTFACFYSYRRPSGSFLPIITTAPATSPPRRSDTTSTGSARAAKKSSTVLPSSIQILPRRSERVMIASLTTTAVVAAPPGRQGECGKQEISGWTASTTLSSLADKARQSNPSADHACWELLSNGDGHAVPSHQVAGAPVTTYLEHYRPGDLLKFPRRFYDHCTPPQNYY
mmetsp:Transcript_16051/g.28547  ORF Transcript_16051/g.28547 Transcript_16051/m.28547 type:complete len:209 (-) Transcript_16051:1334-1960(-)